MTITLETVRSWLDIAVQLLILIVPAVIAWLIRTYVRSTERGARIASISRLANAAIDYVENQDKQGELLLTPGARKSAEKLRIAARWLDAELRRAGLAVGEEEARRWVAAEFQRRIGDVRPFAAIAELARTAVSTVTSLDQHRLLTPPPGVDRADYLAGLAADWLVIQLGQQKGATISREEALSWVRAEIVSQLQQQLGALPQADRLARLSEGAAAFLDQLKASGRLRGAGPAMEADIATAWLLTEAARQGIEVDGPQIVAAIERVLRPPLSVPPRGEGAAVRVER
ncbi:MAG TPA: hypothetical protein VNL77_01250 [Roseiflexaceae bacterium]|nr:hypothetical protein [Roseiflexaceae bacterium]